MKIKEKKIVKEKTNEEKMADHIRFNMNQFIPNKDVLIEMSIDFLDNANLNKKQVEFIKSNFNILFRNPYMKFRDGNLELDLSHEFKMKRAPYSLLQKFSECEFFLTSTKKIGIFTITPKSIYRDFPEWVVKSMVDYKNSPDYQPHYHEQLKMPEWLAKRDIILKRDNFQCTKCKKGYNLQVHHVKYRKLNGVRLLAWEYNNDELITVCGSCHEEIHDGNRGW